MTQYAELRYVGRNRPLATRRHFGPNAGEWIDETSEYNGQRWLSSRAWVDDAGADLLRLDYSHNGRGHITDRTYADLGEGDAFQYNDLHALVGAKLDVPATDLGNPFDTLLAFDEYAEYSYDQAHSFDQITRTDGNGDIEIEDFDVLGNSHRYDSVNTSSLLYDPRGNLIWDGTFVYQYDFRNRLTVTAVLVGPDIVPVSYHFHDPLNRRLMTLRPVVGQSTMHIWDGLREAYTCKDVAGQWIEDQVYLLGDSIDDRLGYVRWNASQSTWDLHSFIQSPNSSVQALSDDGGNVVERYRYDSFGNVKIQDGSGTSVRAYSLYENRFLYSGRPMDPLLGHTYFRSRDYSAKLGRFLTEDPTGVWGDPLHNGNPYAFAGNNTLNNVDPMGYQYAGVMTIGPHHGAQFSTTNPPQIYPPDFQGPLPPNGGWDGGTDRGGWQYVDLPAGGKVILIPARPPSGGGEPKPPVNDGGGEQGSGNTPSPPVPKDPEDALRDHYRAMTRSFMGNPDVGFWDKLKAVGDLCRQFRDAKRAANHPDVDRYADAVLDGIREGLGQGGAAAIGGALGGLMGGAGR